MDPYVKITVIENEIEAQLLDSILNEREIPHMVTSYYDTAYDGLYQTQKGWGYVSAPRPYREEIKRIISELREQASK